MRSSRLWKICGALVLSGAAATGSYSADVLWEQPVDFLNRWDSFYSPTGVQFGDDYLIEEPVVVQSATFWMVATWPNVPWTWSFTLHDGTYSHRFYDFAPRTPYIFRMLDPSTVTDLGPWPTDSNLHLLEVRFDNINMLLEPYLDDERAYWFSCGGFLANYPIDKCYWATAGDGVINGDMGYIKWEPPDWPGWSLMSRANLPPSDFAFRIEGVPADEYELTTELVEFSREWGRINGGDIDSIRIAGDNDILDLRGLARGPEVYRRGIVDTAFTCSVENPDVLDVAVSGAIHTGFVGEVLLWMKNHSTGEFEEVGRNDLWSTILARPVRGIPEADYVSKDGRIELRIEMRHTFSNRSSTLAQELRCEIDHVSIDARHEN